MGLFFFDFVNSIISRLVLIPRISEIYIKTYSWTRYG